MRLERDFIACNMEVVTFSKVPIENPHDLAFSRAKIAMCLDDRFGNITQIGRHHAIHGPGLAEIAGQSFATNQSTVL